MSRHYYITCASMMVSYLTVTIEGDGSLWILVGILWKKTSLEGGKSCVEGMMKILWILMGILWKKTSLEGRRDRRR